MGKTKENGFHTEHMATTHPQTGEAKMSLYHVDIKLVQASEGRLGNGPQREDEAHGGEGALAAGEGSHVVESRSVPLSRLHLECVNRGEWGVEKGIIRFFTKRLPRVRKNGFTVKNNRRE